MPPERTLLEVFAETVRAHPQEMAIDDGATALSYAALAREVEQAAARLRAAGIGTGDRVGVRMPAGTAEIYVAILAVLTSGAAYVPVDADDPDARAETVWAQAGVAAVLRADSVIDVPAAAEPRGASRAVTPDDDAWVIFTSGTTGRPRGVAVTHRSAAALVDAEAQVFARARPLGPGDRVLAGLSVAFDASCEEMWLAWRSGACLVPAPRVLVRAGADLCPWLTEHHVTVVSTVPTLAAQWPADGLAGVRLMILGGEACPPALVRRFATGGREVWNTYGPTEATVVTCGAVVVPGETVRIGLPLPGWQVAVVDVDGAPVAWGETGELVIGGVGLARYLDPADEVGRFTPMPQLGWSRGYRTGDLVVAEPAGLVFLGRRDAQVKIRGHRIEPAELEAALCTHPQVRQAHVRAVDGGSGTRLVAYVVGPGADLDAGGDVDVAALRRHLAGRLPAAMLPDVVVPLTRMPATTSGKIDVAALPEPAAPPAHTPGPLPAEPEELVAAVWREVLGILDVSSDDNFFEIGGHSLLVARVQQRLGEALGRPVPAVALFAHPTVRALAGYLRGPHDTAPSGPARERRRRRRARPASTW